MAARRRERWYSSDGQHRIHRSALASSKGTRQLVSLVLLLVLTLIAIQQVSDSRRVGRVASAIGLLPKPTETPNPQTAVRELSDSTFSPSEMPLEASIDEAMPTESALEELTLNSEDPSIALQARILERLLAGAPQKITASLLERSTTEDTEDEELATWLATARSTLAQWMDRTDSLAPEHATLVSTLQSLDSFYSPPIAADDAERFGRALRLALDRVLLRSFVDNTPWRTDDRLPLIRTTERAVAMHRGMQSGWLVPEMIPRVSVPQLMAQTATHRGHGVRIAGTIALIDQPAALDKAGSESLRYGVLWLRPDDGSNQPILVHIPTEVDVPSELLAADQSIAVTGLLAKRRAYASNRGGDIAPVIVAAAIQAAPNADTQPPALNPTQRAVSHILNRPSTSATWSPPVDVSGALQRVEQRLASRLPALESIAFSASANDREAMAALALNETILASLIGISKVTDEIALLTRAGRNTVPGSKLEVVSVEGTVTQAIRVPIASPPFPGLEWKEVYACIIEPQPAPNASNSTWIAIASSVPLAWLDAPELRQPCVVQGIALPTAADEHTLRTVLSASLQWRLPESAGSEDSQATRSSIDFKPTLHLGWQSLLNRGWNLAWIDMLESLHGQPMSARESEAFYSMLAAARLAAAQSPATQLAQAPAAQASSDQGPLNLDGSMVEPLGIMNLIRRAEGRKRDKGSRSEATQSVGFRAEGTVQIRRVQRIAVESTNDRDWLGADHYYQLDGFADIGRNRIEIQYGEGNQIVVFEREFPVTLVAAQVPDWLLVESGDADASGSQAWYPRARIDVGGWFYRVWRYKTTQVSAATDDSQSQQGPMLVIDRMHSAQALPVVNASNASPAWINATTSFIGILGVLFIAWKIRRGMNAQRRNSRR